MPQVNDRVTYKSVLSVYMIAGNSVLGCFFFGYALSYLNVSLKTVNTVFNIDSSTVDFLDGLLTALLPIGAALGAILAGPILASVSRTNSMIITDFIGILGVLLGEAVNLYSLGVSRLIVGVAVGLNSTIVPLYIKEFTPLSLRGTVGAMNQVTVNGGIFLGFLMGLGFPVCPDRPDGKTQYYCPETGYWRYVFILPISFCVIRTLCLLTIFKDDPPGYYISIKDTVKAEEVLNKIYQAEFVQEILEDLDRDEKQKQIGSSNYSDLLTPMYKRRLMVGCMLCGLQQLCGINSVIFYSTSIFSDINSNLNFVNSLNIAVGITNVAFAFTAGILMQKFGRKQLLIFGDFICFASLVILAIFAYVLKDDKMNKTYQYLVVIFIFVYLVGFQLSLGPITWVYLAEILPEKGLSIAVLVNWVCVSIVAQIFPLLVSSLGIYSCFLIFSVMCFLGLFFLIFLVQETKGKTAISIDNMYSLQGGSLLLDSDDSTKQPNRKN